MTNSELNALVAGELRGLPRGSLAQNLYRAAYEQARLNSLGSRPQMTPTSEAAHEFALDLVRQQHPHFRPERRQSTIPPEGGSWT